MNHMLNLPMERMVSPPPGFTELVRGSEERLIELMTPVVEGNSTVLDMSEVRRIDAAGIAALISIYGSSRNAGHTFRVANVTPHVEEILKLVGLDHVLVANGAVQASLNQTSVHQKCYECPAA